MNRGDTQFLYIAGPYRGKATSHDHHSYFEIDANILTARFWAAECAKAGIPYFCPHLNSDHMEVIVPEVPSSYWLDMDLKILRCASGLLLLPNWRTSRGTMAERETALALVMPIYMANEYALPMIKADFAEQREEESVAVH